MADSVEGQSVLKCVRCGHSIGVIHHIDGYDVLQLGGSMTRRHDGSCEKCGLGFHWYLSDQSMERLVRHVLALRQ